MVKRVKILIITTTLNILTSEIWIAGVYFIVGFWVHSKGILPRIWMISFDSLIYLNMWVYIITIRFYNLFCFDKVRNISLLIYSTSIISTTISIDTSSWNKCKWECYIMNRNMGNNFYKTKNGFQKKIFRKNGGHCFKLLNDWIIKLYRINKRIHTKNWVLTVRG